MHFTTIATVAALSATASAYSGIKSNWYNSTCDGSKPRARIVNNCPYNVYAWTVDSDDSDYDCKFHDGLELTQGSFYWENFRPASEGAISIKLAKQERCENDGHIVQLEYNVVPTPNNYLDVSFVNCQEKDCPTAKDGEGWKLVAGNDPEGKYPNAGADKAICPSLECNGWEDCKKKQMAYFLPDDVQTRSCNVNANLDFYLCGDEEPNAPSHEEVSAKPEPTPSSKPSEEAPAPTEDAPTEDTPTEDTYAAIMTDAPDAKKAHVKTIIEYKTVHVNAHRRRHAHHNYHS